jgi:hypothetical protein
MNPIETTFTTGATLYAVIHHTDGTVWNDSLEVFEAYDDSKWAQYAIPLTEQGSSGYYRGTFPAGAKGDFLTTEVVYQQAGGSPTLGDAPATGVGQSQGFDVAAIAASVVAASNLNKSLLSMIQGAVTSAGVATASKFFTDLADDTDYVYVGRIVVWTSGVLIRQVGNITVYNGLEKSITVGGPFTQAPGVADTFIIV